MFTRKRFFPFQENDRNIGYGGLGNCQNNLKKPCLESHRNLSLTERENMEIENKLNISAESRLQIEPSSNLELESQTQNDLNWSKSLFNEKSNNSNSNIEKNSAVSDDCHRCQAGESVSSFGLRRAILDILADENEEL